MKLKKLFLLLLLPFVFMFAGCQKSDLEKASKNLNTYSMDIVYNGDYTFSVKQTLEYKNHEDTPLDSLSLHLYPRSFREGASSSVVSNLNYSKCYYNGVSHGDINISKLTVNDTPKDVVIGGNDEDILIVKFDEKFFNFY